MLRTSQVNGWSLQQGTNNDHQTNSVFRRNTENHIDGMGSSLQLWFLNGIHKPVFTGVPIKGEDCRPIMVALVDTNSGEIVKSGPEASVRVKIVVLEVDTGECLGYIWTPEEFQNKIVTEDGNKRLLTGDVELNLEEGIGFVGTVSFSHTKIWKKKHAYRLGAVAKNVYIGTQIREGFTESFFVKDRRLDLNKKHFPPTLSDEVWRLNGISKDGAFHQRLSDDHVNIKTVEDLLKKLNTDPQKLRDILGGTMSNNLWKVIVDHAQTCVLDERVHLYSSPEPQQKISVLFNVVGQVQGLLSEFEYIGSEMLSEYGKAHSMDLVASAFQQWDRVLSFVNEASFLAEYLATGDEFDLPQAAVVFNDTTMESHSSSKIIFSSNFDELHFPQPSVLDELHFPKIDESSKLQLVVPSQGIFQNLDSVWDTTDYNDPTSNW